MPCQFPGCPFPSPSDWCIHHGKIYGTKTAKAAPTTLSIPELMERAQKVFNAFIRDRDRAKGCITCGGQVTDCGHFIPVGENGALRFEEDNAAGQCNFCNAGKNGNRLIFRAVQIQRIGEARVIELEIFPKFHKFSRTQLENIIDHYSLSKYSPK